MQTTITLAQETKRARTIKPGTKVVPILDRAMFDKDRFSKPETFRADRSTEDFRHNGHALHVCFGRYVSRADIPAEAK